MFNTKHSKQSKQAKSNKNFCGEGGGEQTGDSNNGDEKRTPLAIAYTSTNHSKEPSHVKTDNASLLVHITAIIVGILLSVFFVSTVNNMATISMRAESITWGPYPVSILAGRIETNIVHLRSLFEKMDVQTRDESMIAQTRQTYDTIMQSLDTQFNSISEANTNEIKAVDDLVSSYQHFDDITDQLITYYSDISISDSIWQEYLSNRVMPAIDQILDDDSKILDSTTNQVAEAYEDAKQATSQTVMLSCILMAAVAIMIVVYLACLRRKNMQEENLMDALSETLVEAQSASAAKSDFLSNMSHDIRTPLNAIIGLTIIANDNFDNQLRVKQCLNRIATSSQHLLGLINDVLDMNKIEAGRVELSVDNISLSELTDEITNIVAPQVREKNLNCDVEIDDITHEFFIGDTLRLRQVFLNLVSNAIKYTNEGDSILITIREIYPTDDAFINLDKANVKVDGSIDDYDVANIEFKIADTGIGMKPEFLKFIFQPFERERNDFTNFTEGTGLGMAITKKLVDLMGGRISVESELGVGSTFTITLPFLYKKAIPELDISGFDDIKILLIASSDAILNSAITILSEFGVDVSGTTNGKHGILMAQKAARENRDFNAVMIGPATADMYGPEIAKQVRLHTDKDKTQIILAVYEDSVYHNKGYDDYIDAFVMKPMYKSRFYDLLKRKCIDHTDESVFKPAKEKMQYDARILLVEDNEINMEIAREILSAYGVEIDEAIDGLDAFSKITTKPEAYYDLIFMDCQMPHMNGLETTEAIRKFEKDTSRNQVTIVAMTANAFDEDRQKALDAGMDGFLVKPIDMKELEATLRKHLPQK